MPSWQDMKPNYIKLVLVKVTNSLSLASQFIETNFYALYCVYIKCPSMFTLDT